MKKRIDPVAIASVGNYITKQNEELKQVKTNFLSKSKLKLHI